ncbi:YcxB family protein [Blastopirellula marina]|uniref:YcxB-like C-terminal domain-containing protein n=1 Tax=Blastopirellula marina TaxID=124 RepID=A0A2S8GPY6_9BACT|nr:YcxB family protein [Blastopirellula marina]PQO46498.1 hypothetical protein C5Y93_08465 [Blastopirellula marina]
MQVTFKNEPRDVAAIFRALPWRDRLFFYLQGFQILNIFWPPSLLALLLNEWLFLGILLSFVAILLLIHTYKYLRIWWNMAKNGKVVPGDLSITIDEDFLELRSEFGGARRLWKHVSRIHDEPNYVVFFITPLRAYVIPKRFFASGEEAEQFVRRGIELKEGAVDRPPPEVTWESFARDSGFEQLHLIRHLKWEIDPQICARIETVGIDTEAKNTIPTFWSLCGQLLFPGFLTLSLLMTKWGYSAEVSAWYFVVLSLTIVIWMFFGLQLNTYLRFRTSLARQYTAIQPNEARFFAEGIGTVTEEGARFSHWKMLEVVANDQEAIVIYDIAPFIYVTIPKVSFFSAEEEEFIRERMQECHDFENDVSRDAILAEQDDVIVADLADNPFRSPPPR